MNRLKNHSQVIYDTNVLHAMSNETDYMNTLYL